MRASEDQGFYLMRRAAVEQYLGLSTQQIYTAMAAGTFPRPLRTGRNSVAWLSLEIESWKQARIAERDTGEPVRPPFRYTEALPPGRRMLRRAEVLRRIGKSSASLYRDISLGLFPSPVSVGAQSTVFLESEVNDWIQERLTERNRQYQGRPNR